MSETLDREILVLLTADRLETAIRDLGDKHEEELKAKSIDVREFQICILDLVGEAYEVLKAKAQQTLSQ